MPIFCGYKDRYYFKVKDKWLQQLEFVEGEFYQGNLELKFYSMDCPDLSRDNRFRLIPTRIIKEGYFVKLTNVKQVKIDDVD